MLGISALLLALRLTGLHAQFAPNCAAGRDGNAMVHLFEWKWTDIAAECERFLGPKGFCGVQVSPPNEHRIVTSPFRPWWERYQPVSYKLEGRSGTRAQFADMVRRCNAAGVRIYVDAVINHMTGTDAGSGVGTGGSSYDASSLSFPGVPYTASDFSSCSKCTNANCQINNDYDDADKIRNCQLFGLIDLDLEKDSVRQKIADYMNDVIALGVDGFRIDAAKHMWPSDLQAIMSKTRNTLTGNRPFFYFEVIDLYGSEAVKSIEYAPLGAVMEFKYGLMLSDRIHFNKGLSSLRDFGQSWGMLPDNRAFVFVDNHDNQRGHGGIGGEILTHVVGRPYRLSVVFMLAWPYGIPQVMSSYSFASDWSGPPSADGQISDVPINADGQCGGGWICEHRWRAVANMVAWRNSAGSQPVGNWWTNGNNQIAFSRGSSAFIAINYNDGLMSQDVNTGLPAGMYCDVISGEVVNGQCTGKVVAVGNDGRAKIEIDGSAEDPFVAIHSGSKIA